jgi:hypothetical protein
MQLQADSLANHNFAVISTKDDFPKFLISQSKILFRAVYYNLSPLNFWSLEVLHLLERKFGSHNTYQFFRVFHSWSKQVIKQQSVIRSLECQVTWANLSICFLALLKWHLICMKIHFNAIYYNRKQTFWHLVWNYWYI